jgi:DNA processing protein
MAAIRNRRCKVEFTLPVRLPTLTSGFFFDGRAADEEWEKVARLGANITLASPEYPERLREIYDPPPVLWIRGAAHLSPPHRSQSPARATLLPMALARRDVTPPGSARPPRRQRQGREESIPVPAEASSRHACPLTLWGLGSTFVYPKENRKMAEEILAIVSDLSIGVLAVEASENSGTRVRARCAAEQDRDLRQRNREELVDT